MLHSMIVKIIIILWFAENRVLGFAYIKRKFAGFKPFGNVFCSELAFWNKAVTFLSANKFVLSSNITGFKVFDIPSHLQSLTKVLRKYHILKSFCVPYPHLTILWKSHPNLNQFFHVFTILGRGRREIFCM